jgi:hypothetical protein
MDLIMFSILFFSVNAVVISALSAFKHYNPHPKRFKDLITGKCGFSLALSSVFFANYTNYALELYGYSLGGV